MMADCLHKSVASDSSDEGSQAGQSRRHRRSLRLPPQMREAVVSSLTTMSSLKEPVFNLVLCGREELLKTCAAKAFTESHSFYKTSELENVYLRLLPGLFGKSKEEVKRESSSFISKFDPESVSAFIHVLPLSPPTDEDKKEFRVIQNSFKSQIKFLTMILFTMKPNQTAADQEKLFKNNKDIQELIKSCDGQYFFLKMKEKQGFAEAWDEETEKKMGSSSSQSEEELRMVLIGKTGSGKSTTANTILGRKAFTPKALPKRANTTCEKQTGEIDGRPVALVNTPDLNNTDLSDEEIQGELSKCFSLLAPGPHVFLLVMQIGFISPKEKHSVELIKRVFGERAKDFIIIIFSRGEALEDESFESYIKNCDGFVKKMVDDCGGRYQVISKNADTNRQQVKELLTKIESIVRKNGGGCYCPEIFGYAKEAAQREGRRTIKRYHEEIEEMKKKLEALESEKKQNWKTPTHHKETEELKKKVEALEREKQQQEKMEEMKKKLEALESEKQQNWETMKQHKETEELKKKLEALEREKQLNQRDKKHQEEVEKLRQEMRDLKAEMGKCNIS